VKASRLVLPPGREVSFARVVVAPGANAKVEVPRQ
jgi:putative transposon-encoded protein